MSSTWLHTVSNVSIPSVSIDMYTRSPPTIETLAQYVLPVLSCAYLTTALLTLPHTYYARTALLPITFWTLFQCATHLDFSYGSPGQVHWNQGMMLILSAIGMRAIGSVFRNQVLVRIPPQPKGQPKEKKEKTTKPIEKQSTWSWICDASDLVVNHRGIGWNWSRGLRLGTETRSTTSTTRFLLATFFSCIAHFLAFDLIHYAMQSISPRTFGSPMGGTIFLASVSTPLRYVQSSVVCILASLLVYCAIQGSYDALTIIGIQLLSQGPADYPPIFNAPWLATSVDDFWTHRWHQLFRDSFINVGFKPAAKLFGRIGGTLGAYFVSGMFHDVGLWGMGRSRDTIGVYGSFLLMGVGAILESTWGGITGKKVGGFSGWVWTMVWLIVAAHPVVDAWAKSGTWGAYYWPADLRPSAYLFGPLPVLA